MVKRDFSVAAALGIAFVILLAVNLAASVLTRNVKVDLTEGRLYTLSPGSRSLLKKLDESVKLKLFYSKRPASSLPNIKQYADRVIELLKQFKAASGGKATLEILEPRPDTETEEWAVKYGLKPYPAGEEPLYFGLVVVSETGEERSIPFLEPSREQFLEYDVARLVSAISHPEKKTIGVMSPLSVMGSANDPMARMQGMPPADPWVFISELRQSFNVKEVPITAGEIDKTIDLLLVIHPKKLSDQTEYAIDQYVLKGGRVIVLADAHCEYDMRNSHNPNPQARLTEQTESSLPKLFKAWGIEMPSGKVIADPTTSAKVNVQNRVMDYIVFLLLPKENCNQQEIISSNMERLLFGCAGALKKAKDAKYEITPLIESSPAAMEMDEFKVKLMGMTPNPDFESLTRDYVPGNQKLGIAYKITGKFETAFPGGKPESLLPKEPNKKDADKDKKETKSDHVAQAEKENTVIVISDVDFITDDFAVDIRNFLGQKIATARFDNLNFINNAIELMTGSDDLVSLRTRGKSARPFAKVDALEHKAQEKWRTEEVSLQKKLEETTQKLQELQRGKAEEGGQKAILSESQRDEIKKFRSDEADTKKKLREVKRSLRQDIESLGARIKFVNIAFMPFLVFLMSFLPAAWRSYRMRSSRG